MEENVSGYQLPARKWLSQKLTSRGGAMALLLWCRAGPCSPLLLSCEWGDAAVPDLWQRGGQCTTHWWGGGGAVRLL